MAGKGLGTLTLDLVAKIGGFTAPLEKAERQMERGSRAMAKDAGALREAVVGAFMGMVAGISASGLGAALTGLANSMAQSVKDVERFAGEVSFAVMSQRSDRAIRFRSSVITRMTRCLCDVRVTTVSLRHWEKEPVLRPSPNRPSSLVA